jgi:beta-galactosidase
LHFTATHYTPEILEKAAHPCDLVEDDAMLLRLDAQVSGVGTTACGPGVRDEWMVKPDGMDFGFLFEIPP